MGETKVKKIALGSEVVWSGGNVVTYITGNGTYQEEVEEGATCLSPTSFTPAISGWTFIGWRTDKTASGSVISNLIMGDAPITLYAVFRQTITLSYAGNGATSGSTSAQTGYRYYNNGNVVNPSFTVKANGFAKSGYIWTGWKSGSTDYAVGQSITLSSNLTLTAQWYTAAVTNFGYTGGIQTWTVPVTGLYLLKAYGAKGSTNWNAGGANGGYAYRYVQLNAGQTIYVVCGGSPGDRVETGGYNGGGKGYAPGSTAQYCGYGGGGATHMATRSGTLQALGSTSGLLIVAGGAGGAGGVRDSSYGYGGAGGGLTGEDGRSNVSDRYIRTGKGGTQSRGGYGVDASGNIISAKSGAFGKGGDAIKGNTVHGGGGGGGLYGGGAGDSYNGASGGGGGSSYIGASTTTFKGKSYTNGTTAGQCSGNGSASVQLIAA